MWRLALAVLLTPLGVAQAQDFQKSYAIVVGVDDYSGVGLPKLANAESDARAVERYFRAQRYLVTPLIGPLRLFLRRPRQGAAAGKG